MLTGITLWAGNTGCYLTFFNENGIHIFRYLNVDFFYLKKWKNSPENL